MRNRKAAWLTSIGIVALVLVVAPVAALALTRPADDTVLAGVHVDGDDVGGMSESQLRSKLADDAESRADRPVAVTGEMGTAERTRGELGEAVDVEATVDDAMARGRQDPLRAARDLFDARRDERMDVDLAVDVDDAALEGRTAEVADELSAEPRDAAVDLVGDGEPRVEPTEARAGADVDAEALAERVREALTDDDGELRIDAPEEVREPAITDDDGAGVRADAERVVADDVTLTNPSSGGDLTLSPSELALVVDVVADEGAEPGERLELTVDRETLESRIDQARDALDVPAVDADIQLSGGSISIGDSAEGYRVSASDTADVLLDVIASEDRTGELVGSVVEPDRSRADAEALGIVEPVSEFTTEHAPDQSRVQNIQRMADIVDGAVVEPGESFSINEHVGPRTENAGFVEGGVIIDGEFEEAIGGGTSQFATTFFNAAFFAGVQLDAFRPHSYYISRYPEGREATLSFSSGLDVVFTNDTDFGILIDTSYTDSSITVTFWSTDHRDVEASDSGRRNVVPGEVRDGFDITISRVVRQGGQVIKEESWNHRYNPEDANDD